MASVYLITNTVTGKSYVGMTSVSVDRRWAQHRRDIKNRDGVLEGDE